MVAIVEEYIPGPLDKPRTTIKSDKFNHSFLVAPTEDGFVFYKVSVTAGNVPDQLKGMYSTMKHAVEAVLFYEERAKPSKTVERDKKTKAREEQKLQVFDEE